MAVHMIRVLASADGMTHAEITTAMDAWVGNHSEWAEDTAPHHITARNTHIDGSGTDYYGGDYRFHTTDAKRGLLTACAARLRNEVAWYRHGYHRCSHDEATPSACGWDDQREWTDTNVTIPAAVPDFR